MPDARSAARLRRQYAALAPIYDRFVPLVSSRARALGVRWLRPRDGEHLLDVGTGTGRALLPLAADNPTGWTEGLDASPAMLARARRRMRRCPHDRYGLRRGDATALPYPSGAFDAVFAGYTVDVLPTTQIRPCLRELRRVLRPDGRLVLVYLAPPTRPVEYAWAAVARACPPLFGGDRPMDLRSRLPDTGVHPQRYSTRTQLGLRSGIVRARPT
jgi:demethylmenaquinone methyltransferase/2-methoxy-6-polyprenyl-1,4-benzoquinol methylase